MDLCKTITDEMRRYKKNCNDQERQSKKDLIECNEQKDLISAYYTYAMDELNREQRENQLFRKDLMDCLNTKSMLPSDMSGYGKSGNVTIGHDYYKLKSQNEYLSKENLKLQEALKGNKTHSDNYFKTHNFLDELFGVCHNKKCESFYASKIMKLLSIMKTLDPQEKTLHLAKPQTNTFLELSKEIYNDLNEIAEKAMEFFESAADAILPDFS